MKELFKKIEEAYLAIEIGILNRADVETDYGKATLYKMGKNNPVIRVDIKPSKN